MFGGSGGSTLALAYAQAHAQTVTGLVLRGVFLGSRAEINAYLYGLRDALPEAWASFAAAVDDDDLLTAYHRAIHGGDGDAALRAAQAWNDWDHAVNSLGGPPSPNPVAGAAALARARVQTHYLVHDCFLAPGTMLAGVPSLYPIPCHIVQGRQDRVCPPAAPLR